MKKAIAVGLGVGLLIGFLYIVRGQKSTLPAPVTRQEISPKISPAPLSKPTSLKIPRLDVNAQVEYVGLDKDGNMDVPKNPANVAWFRLGYFPGQQGSSVIAGHFDTPTGAPAVFYRAAELEEGDEIEVVDEKGRTLTFIVTAKETHPYDNFPLVKVFGPNNEKVLNLITCEGTFNREKKSYSHRTVIYSRLKD